MIAFTTKSTSPSDQDLQHRVALFVQQRQLTCGAKVTVSARRGVVILKGTVSKAEWVNPHSWVYLEVRGAQAQPTDGADGADPPIFFV